MGQTKRKTFCENIGFYLFWGWVFLAVVGIMDGWLVKYILVTIYSLLFSGVRTVVLFDLSLSSVPSCLISFFHNYVFGKLEYHTAVKGSWQGWRGRQYWWPPGLSPDLYSGISKHALTPRGRRSLYGVCWVEWDISVYHYQTFFAINVKLRNKMCKEGYIHMRSPDFCQPLVLV